MSLQSALRYVANSPETPAGIATYGCHQIEGDEPRRVLVEEEHRAPVQVYQPWMRLPPVARRKYYVEPMHRVVDEEGVWWAVGWSVDARYAVFWRLGFQPDPLEPTERYVLRHGRRSNIEGT